MIMLIRIQLIGLSLIFFTEAATGKIYPLLSPTEMAQASDAVAILHFQTVRNPSEMEMQVLQNVGNPFPKYLEFQIADFSVKGFIKGDGPESVQVILLAPKNERGKNLVDLAKFRRGTGKLKFADGTDSLVTCEYLAYLKSIEGSRTLFTLTYGGVDQGRSIRLLVPPF